MGLPKEWSVFKQSFSQLLTLISKLILEKKLPNMLILFVHQILNTGFSAKYLLFWSLLAKLCHRYCS